MVADTGFANIESPVRRFRRPRGSSRTEFEFARAQVKPVDVIDDQICWEIVEKYRPGNKL
jgi:hypothetical protein